MQQKAENENKIERLTASVTEAAQMIGVSERTIHKLTKSGRLPHKRIGTRIVYPIERLRQFVNECETSEE